MIGEGPLYVNWNYTSRCNFNCDHCYSRGGDSSEELTTKEYKTIVDKLTDAKVFQINLGGGEPTLRNDYLEIIKYISDKKVKVNLSTNGWFIDEKAAEKLRDNKIGTIYVSIDHSIPEMHDKFRNMKGSFERATNAVRLCVSKGISVVFSTVITKINFDFMDDIVNLAKKLGAERVDFKRVKIKGNSVANEDKLVLNKTQEKELYDKIKMLREKYNFVVGLVYGDVPFEDIDQGCPCGKTALGLATNGNILPCVYNTFTIGNILKDDIKDIWKNSPQLKLMRENLSCMGLPSNE